MKGRDSFDWYYVFRSESFIYPGRYLKEPFKILCFNFLDV